MTEDDLDLLASAYLDGEATSEEVAMVERDPDLLARVEQLRAVSARLGAPVIPPAPALKEQHLAAALAQFDLLGDMADQTVEMTEGNVIDLSDRAGRADRPRSGESRRASRSARRSAPRAVPQWLGAAAALFLVGGGVIWVAGRSGSEDTDAASFPTEEGSDSADVAADSADGGAGGAADAEAATAQAESARDESAESQMVTEEADTAADDPGGAESAGPADDSAERSTTAPAVPNNGGFFPEEPVASYARQPELVGILDELPAVRTDLSRSRCGGILELPVGTEPIGYLPIEIEGQPTELFVVFDQSGLESTVIVDDTCRQLLP